MQLISRKHNLKCLSHLIRREFSESSDVSKYSYDQIAKQFDYGDKRVNPEKLIKFQQRAKNSSEFLESFKQYSAKVLPFIEDKLEMEYIQEWIDQVDNQHVKKLIIESYKKRRLMVETEEV